MKNKSKFLPYCKRWFRLTEYEDGFLYSLFYKTINLDGIPYMLNVWKNQIEFHPVTVCQYALNAYNQKRFDVFLKRVNFLMYKQEQGWLYHYFKPKMWGYAFKTPWVSSMVQGLFLSCLVRALALTKDMDYQYMADQVFKTLKSPKVYKKGFYYEFGTKNPRVLNGHMYTLIGLRDFDQKIPETDLRNFNHYGWSRYDDKHLIADYHYHRRHQDLYQELYGTHYFSSEGCPELVLRIIHQKIRGVLA